MRNKKPLSRSSQVIAFLKAETLVDEKAVAAKKVRTSAPKKSKAKTSAPKKSKAAKKKVAFQSHQFQPRQACFGF